MADKIFSLEGRVALITGATGGLGRAIAKLFHSCGATIVISGTKEAILEEFASKFDERIYHIQCNLEDKEKTNKLVEDTIDKAGGLDILICNAGLNKDGLAIRMSDEDFEKVIKVNLESSFILNREAIKYMFKKKYGRIINISSVVAFTGNFGQANYCASKAGMVGMSKSLAAECGSRNITVNCIAPGFIVTPMTDSLNDDIKNRLLQKIPCQRFGSPDDIAFSALFLASDEASYITGHTLHVNGGMYTN